MRRAIVAAASEALREQGVRGLSVAAVLDRAELSTRAFYRHFDSKDQVVAAVFLEMAYAEKRRLQRKMAKAANPVEAVVAWIDGRLDLAFDENIKSDLRRLSLEAQSQMFAAPELIQPAYEEMLEPLIEQLHRGLSRGVFHDIDPVTEAQSIQGVVWASTERHWAAGDCHVQRSADGSSFLPARSRGGIPKPSPTSPRATDCREQQWTWVWPDRRPSSPAAARAWGWRSRKLWQPKEPVSP